METKKLILKSEPISVGYAFAMKKGRSICLGIAGVILIIYTLNEIIRVSSRYSYFGALLYSRIYEFIFLFLGFISLFLAFFIPYRLAMKANKMYINVYEDKVCGIYRQDKKYIPYELTFDKIESVSVIKKRVFLQISGRTLESSANNAEEIKEAISERLS